MHDCLLRIQGIRTWWVIIGSKSLGIGFEYIGELILTWIWKWDVCQCMRMKWMKSILDSCKYSIKFLVTHQLFDKNTKKSFFVFFVSFVVYLSCKLRDLSYVAQVSMERTIFITCYVRLMHLPFFTNNHKATTPYMIPDHLYPQIHVT